MWIVVAGESPCVFRLPYCQPLRSAKSHPTSALIHQTNRIVNMIPLSRTPLGSLCCGCSGADLSGSDVETHGRGCMNCPPPSSRTRPKSQTSLSAPAASRKEAQKRS